MYAERGFTLVEVVMTIAILGIVAIALLSAQAIVVRRSADPMIARQAISIAEAYLDEILAKDYLDPNTATICPAAPASRSLYDNVCDYNNLSGSIADQFGNNSGLTNYSATVTVIASGNLNGLASTHALRITVAVTDPLGRVTSLTGYRTRY